MQLLRVFQDYPSDRLFVLGPKPPKNCRLLGCSYKTLPFGIHRWRNTRFHRLAMSAVLTLPWLRPGSLMIWKKLGSFKPDVVFTVMDNVSHFVTAFEFAKKHRLPLITMTMDEPDSFEKIYPAFITIQQNKIRDVYKYAEKNLCVSRQMTRHIAHKYDCETETFYFGPPDGMKLRPAAESSRLKKSGVLTLGYAGGLTYGYRGAIQNIAKALAGSSVQIRIYSRDKPDWDLGGNLEYAGCFPHEELWCKVKDECDASLLVYDFFHPESRLYRTHFPTKLSEYTWLGMPMVMVGPDYATGIIWGLEHPQGALVGTDPELAGLKDKLEELASCPDKRVTMAQAVGELSGLEFDPIRIRANFMQLVSTKKLKAST